ncbi:myoneurin-like [Octopus bimaculoides]|uniref:myoneurin-like n=1 Tax=Octopus bimaculoides TaxID=37653 RepID=UPI0022E669E4|nr:myoneurin-like [Octopus bimaculoides]
MATTGCSPVRSAMASEEEAELCVSRPLSSSEDLFHIYDNYIRHVQRNIQEQQEEGTHCFLLVQCHTGTNANVQHTKKKQVQLVAHACIFDNFCFKFFDIVSFDEKAAKYVLDVKDFDEETVLIALTFLYTGVVKCSSKLLLDLKRLARYLGLEEVISICNKLIREQKAFITDKEKPKIDCDREPYIQEVSPEAVLSSKSLRNLSTLKSELLHKDSPLTTSKKTKETGRNNKSNSSFGGEVYHKYEGYIKRLWDGLCLQQRQNRFCNLILQFEAGYPNLYIHTTIFSIFCSHFADLAKFEEVSGKYYINLCGYSYDTTVILVGFLYTGILKCPRKLVSELQELSHHLGVKEISIVCEDYLKSSELLSSHSFSFPSSVPLPNSSSKNSEAEAPSKAKVAKISTQNSSNYNNNSSLSLSDYINNYLWVIMGLHQENVVSSSSSPSLDCNSAFSADSNNSGSASSVSNLSFATESGSSNESRNYKFPTLSNYLQQSSVEYGQNSKVFSILAKTKKQAETVLHPLPSLQHLSSSNDSNSSSNSSKDSGKKNSLMKVKLRPSKTDACLQDRKKIYRDVIYVNKDGSQVKGKKVACYEDSLPLPKRKAARPQKVPKNSVEIDLDEIGIVSADTFDGGYRRKRRAVQCPKCPRSFADEKALLKHLNSHEQGVIHKCHVCGMNYARLCDYTRHIRVHTAENQYTCSYCNKVSQTQRDFIEHNKSEHQDNRPFKCDASGCTFQAAKLAYLTDHRHIHSDVKGFICNKCGRTFSQAGGLHSHIKSCYQMQGYLCDLCGQTFNHLGSMKSHRRIHLGEKPHACSDCGARFSDHRNLRRHKRIHENSFPYPCTHCDKRFRHSNSLKAHLRHHGVNVGGTSVTVLIQGNECNYLDPEEFPMCPSPASSEFQDLAEIN